MSGKLSPPEPLADAHDIEEFNSGAGSLDDWLIQHPTQQLALRYAFSDEEARRVIKRAGPLLGA